MTNIILLAILILQLIAYNDVKNYIEKKEKEKEKETILRKGLM
jgi:Tfp pilus assembly protein PilE